LQLQGLSTGSGQSFVAAARTSTVPPRASEQSPPRALRFILLVTLALVGALALVVLRPWAAGEPSTTTKPGHTIC
jgi:hypothetical protein